MQRKTYAWAVFANALLALVAPALLAPGAPSSAQTAQNSNAKPGKTRNNPEMADGERSAYFQDILSHAFFNQ